MRLEAVRAAVLDAARQIQLAGGGSPDSEGTAPAIDPPVSLIALDAEDIEASADALRVGASLEPGSLRWLADAWDAAGRP